MAATSSAPESAWVLIDAEKRRDRLVRRVSVMAWTTTFVILLIYGVIVGSQIAELVKLREVGVIRSDVIRDAVMRLIWVLGIVSLLIATLTTIGVFIRQRAASLTEIQVRLAALEELVLTRTQRDG